VITVRPRSFFVGLAVVLIIVFAFGAALLLKGSPTFDSVEDLAAALRDNGWGCDAEGMSEDAGSEYGYCDLQKSGMSAPLGIVVFETEDARDRQFRRIERSFDELCGAAEEDVWLQGPNWLLTLSESDDLVQVRDLLADEFEAEVICG